MSDDLEELWRDHEAAQRWHHELINKLPSRPIDWITASVEERVKFDRVADELEEAMAKITETWEAIKKFKAS